MRRSRDAARGRGAAQAAWARPRGTAASDFSWERRPRRRSTPTRAATGGTSAAHLRVAHRGLVLDREADAFGLARELVLDGRVLRDARYDDPEPRASGSLDPGPGEADRERAGLERDGVPVGEVAAEYGVVEVARRAGDTAVPGRCRAGRWPSDDERGVDPGLLADQLDRWARALDPAERFERLALPIRKHNALARREESRRSVLLRARRMFARTGRRPGPGRSRTGGRRS